MPREATNADVADIEVEIERPVDRAAKRDHLRSDKGTDSVSGTGTSGTIVTNNSAGNWYAEAVSVHALGASEGVVQVVLQVTDSGGNVVSEAVGDMGGGSDIPMHGQILKPGWSLDYTVSQSDSSAYDLVMAPLFRKPPADDVVGGGGGGSGGGGLSRPFVIDDFEDADISEYVDDTAEFTTTTTQPYYNQTCLELDTATPDVVHRIESTSGLENYLPEPPFTVSCWVWSNVPDSGTGANRVGFLFGSDGSERARAEFRPAGREINLYKANTRISWDLLGTSDNSFRYSGSEWWQLIADYDPDRDPMIDLKARNADGDIAAKCSGNYKLPGDGIGFDGRVETTSRTHRYDYARVVE